MRLWEWVGFICGYVYSDEHYYFLIRLRDEDYRMYLRHLKGGNDEYAQKWLDSTRKLDKEIQKEDKRRSYWYDIPISR